MSPIIELTVVELWSDSGDIIVDTSGSPLIPIGVTINKTKEM